MIKYFNTKEELEFELLAELPDLKEVDLSNLKEDITQLFGYVTLFKVIKKFDDLMIANNKTEYILTDEDCKIDDYLIVDIGVTNKKTDKNKIDYFNIIDNFDFSPYARRLKKIDKGGMGGKLGMHITEAILSHWIKVSEDKYKEELEERKSNEKLSKEFENKKEIYKKEGIYEDEMINVHDNVMDFKRENIKIITKKNILKLFEQVFYDKIPGMCCGKLIQKKEDFSLYWNNNKTYWIDFKRDGTYLNDIKIKVFRLNFVLKQCNIKNDFSKENIQMLSELGETKLKLIHLENLEINNTKIPIKISLISKDMFEVECFNQKKGILWNDLKEIFFRGVNLIDPPANKIIKLSELLGAPKSEVLVYIKKSKVVDEL